MMTPRAVHTVATTIARAIAPRQRLTVSEWSDLHRRLSTKGSAIAGQWRTSRNPPLQEPMDSMSAHSPVREVSMMFPIQIGKALALDTPLPTPHGWTTMGEVQPGQQVLGDDGRPVRVVAASDVFFDHPCYRLTFSDGAQVVADAGHRWQVIDLVRLSEARREVKRRAALDARGGAARARMAVGTSVADQRRVVTTNELAALHSRAHRQSRYAVELAQPLELPSAALPIDPYLLGVWLGDGGTYNAQLSLGEGDAPHILQRITRAGYVVLARKAATDVARASRCITVIVNPRGCGQPTLHALLSDAHVLGHKHIPPTYLRASRAQRLALLQGLLDTDGHASPSGTVEITSSLPALADGIVELARTLGFKPVLRWRKTPAKDSGRITFSALRSSKVFSLPRKLQALPTAHSERGAAAVGLRYITAIEAVATVPTRCIAVDNASHLYLCGREFIPTHNTEAAVNTVGYCMDHNPGPVMVCLPGEVSMDKWVAQKLHPTIEETPAMQAALTSTASRNASNTRTFKDFAGGQLYIEHAGSPQRLKSTTVRTLIVDEVDEFANSLTGGDDPIEMLKGRTSAFPGTSKALYISTPQVRGTSRIEELFDQSDQRRYHVPCPHCGHMQHLQWAGLHWTPDFSRAWYVCQDCGSEIDERHKTAMIAAGRWVPQHPDRKSRGYHINCLYYQIGLGPRWADLAEMWVRAQNDPARLKTFINDRLAETWEDPAMRAVRHNAIADRAEPYPLRTAPPGVLAITAGIDTQDNRLAVQIVGWGARMSFWVLDYIELMGDPADDAVWVQLTELLNRPIAHASGATLVVEAAAVDMGGHRTEAVKSWARNRLVRRPMAIHGAKANTAPILSRPKRADVNWQGRQDRRGVLTYQVGTVAAKHWLYGRLSTDADKDPDARLTHFSDELDLFYFAGLVSETYNPSRNRFEAKRGARNEPLDTWVYAYAAAHHQELRLHRYSLADWQARADRLAAQRADATTIPTTERPPHENRPATNRAYSQPGASAPAGSDWSFERR